PRDRKLLWQPEALESEIETPRVEGLLGQAGDDTAVGVLGGAGEERVDLGDPVAVQGEHVQRKALVAAGLGVPVIEGERLLAAGPRPQGAPAPLPRERRTGEEGTDRLAAVEPAPQGGHREDRVGAEHRDDRLDVLALPGVEIALDELADGLVIE